SLSADPHVWLDPVLYGDIVRTTEQALAAASPTNARTFQANATPFDAPAPAPRSPAGADLRLSAGRRADPRPPRRAQGARRTGRRDYDLHRGARVPEGGGDPRPR